MTLSQPTATPRVCSARAARSATLPTATGLSSSSSAASASPSGSSTQPVCGARRTTPSSRRTSPQTATRGADADRVGRQAGAHPGDQRGEQRGDLLGRRSRFPAAFALVEQLAAEADPGGPQLVHLDAQRVARRPGDSGRTTSEGRPARPVSAGRALADQPGRRQVGGERPDGAAVEPQRRGQFGAGRRSVDVDVAEQRAQVLPADLVLTRPWAHGHPLFFRAARQRVPVAAARRRESASTPAASSSTTPVTMYLTPAL